MLTRIRKSKPIQLVLGLVMGILFGFFLQKGWVTKYDVIVAQLRLTDFTVVKVMLSAVAVSMIGIYAMKDLGWVTLKIKPGSWTKNIIGGLIFGVGFGLLGYCPGTVVGAAGQGSLDALIGGIAGLVVGAGFFAAIFPRVNEEILCKGDFGAKTLPGLLKLHHWKTIPLVCLFIVTFFVVLHFVFRV